MYLENDPMNKNVNEGRPRGSTIDSALRESLSFDHQRVSIIRCNATSAMFVFWFRVSCYFPVLTACLGPIGNTISIACVVEKWRFHKIIDNGVTTGSVALKDPDGIFAVNVLSLVLGFVSNIALLLHFSEKLSYLKAQLICIVGWTTASLMLLIDIIICASKFFDEEHQKSIGFWYAAITSGLYLCCTLTLTTHFVGYLLGKYPAKFNLIKNERSLMVFTVSFSVILIWGGGMFSRLMHVSFGNGLYFCVVSILTVGLGDLLPVSVAARILVLVYSTLGVINLALIIAMTTGIFRSSSGSVCFFHKVEVRRKKELNRIKNGEVSYTSKEAFYKMQSFRELARSRQRLEALLSTLLAFIIFWHLGSLGLKFAENWSYFGGMYFCFLCLLTIGYGDYAPTSGAGRAFFVIWALGAVPMMSAILSIVGDILLELSDSMDLSIARRFKLGLQSIIIHGTESWNKYILNDNEIMPEDESSSDDYEEDGRGEETDSENYGNTNHSSKEASSIASSRAESQEPRFEHVSTGLKTLQTHKPEMLSIFEHPGGRSNYRSLTDGFEGSQSFDLQRIISALKQFRPIARQNKNYSLSFSQWHELSKLNIFSYGPDSFNDPTFWLSEFSPLRFPLNQPKFVVMRLFTRIEQVLSDFLIRKEGHCCLSGEKANSKSAFETQRSQRKAAMGFTRARSVTL